MQYKIELAIDGLADGPPGGMSIADRLKVLLDRREAWNSLRFTSRKVIFANTRHSFSGSHFVWVNLTGQLEVFQVPCTLKGVPEKSWIIEDFRTEHSTRGKLCGIAVDSCLDLLITVEKRYFFPELCHVPCLKTHGYIFVSHSDSDLGMELRLRRLTTGTYHSQARIPSIPVPLGDMLQDRISCEQICVSSNYIAVTFVALRTPKLLVYDWRTGRLCLVSVVLYHFCLVASLNQN